MGSGAAGVNTALAIGENTRYGRPMPADPRRKMITSRMFPETVRKLDAVRAHLGVARNTAVHRSQLIIELVEEAYEKLMREKDKKKRS